MKEGIPLADGKAIVRFHQVTFGFGPAQPVMDSLSFEVRTGEVLALVGPSGSGKSTLFRLLSGLLEAEQGEIHWDGVTAAASERLGRVSYVPQQPHLLPWRSAAANAAVSMEVAGFSPPKALDYVNSQLPLFGLEAVGHLMPSQLSGGMKQRVSLLRAMLHPAPLMLMDEPFSALDSLTRMQMHEWLLALWEREQKTVLLITHDVDEAILLADRILLIRDTPMTTLESYEVPLPRPRHLRDSLLPEFLSLKQRLLAGLGIGSFAAGARVPTDPAPVNMGTDGIGEKAGAD